MIKRNKLYYPKSHIITNLQTQGKEWMLEDGTEYIGFYHRYIDGTVLTGAVFDARLAKKLIPYVDIVAQPDNVIYNALRTNIGFTSPKYYYPKVFNSDYKLGKFTRYFLRRRNYNSFHDIIEVGEDQYKLWKRKVINRDLYQGLELEWKLTGPLNDIRKDLNIEYGVYDTNRRIVILKDKQFVGIRNVLTDYIEFSVHSPLVSTETKKLFGNV